MRRKLIYLHLVLAGVMAPAFLLLAVSGGLYLVGIKGSTADTAVALPADAVLDFDSPDLDARVRALLQRGGIEHDFEYIRNRGSRIELRPTSRTYLSLAQTPDGLRAMRHDPDLQKSLIELHKGHGPQLFKLYQKIVALVLLGVVFGGVAVGLMSRVYRRPTQISLLVGTAVFAALAML